MLRSLVVMRKNLSAQLPESRASKNAVQGKFRGKTMTELRSRHGLNALKVAVKVRGLSAIDMRTAAAQSLVEWRNELLADLGGAPAVSAQRMAVVDMAVRTRLYIDHVDAFLLGQTSLVNRRSKSIVPILRERTQLVDSLARLLGQLGLDRVEKDGGALPAEWITKVRPHDSEAADSEQKGDVYVGERENGQTLDGL
jgi:hypothetical protein